eukprot:6196064-Pyramimonas_sp.AAC.2
MNHSLLPTPLQNTDPLSKRDPPRNRRGSYPDTFGWRRHLLGDPPPLGTYRRPVWYQGRYLPGSVIVGNRALVTFLGSRRES